MGIDNIDKPRSHRQKQLYLWGASSLGKTRLVSLLSEYIHTFWMEPGKFHDGYHPDEHDLIIYDEFHGAHPISFMNRLLEGTPMHIEIKGGSVFKTRNIPIIVLANVPIEGIYHRAHSDRVQALQNRFTIIHIGPTTKWLHILVNQFNRLVDLVDDDQSPTISLIAGPEDEELSPDLLEPLRHPWDDSRY